jgi:hypothetical protein
MNFREIKCEYMNLIYLAQDRDQGLALVNIVGYT